MEELPAVVNHFLYMIVKGQEVPDTSMLWRSLDCILESVRAALAGGNFMQHDRGTRINSGPRWALGRALLSVCALGLTRLVGMCFPEPLTCPEPPPEPFLHVGIPGCIFSARWLEVRTLRLQNKTLSLRMAFAFERHGGCSRDFTTSLTSSVQSPGSVLTVLNLGLHALIPATCIWLEASLNCPVWGGWESHPAPAEITVLWGQLQFLSCCPQFLGTLLAISKWCDSRSKKPDPLQPSMIFWLVRGWHKSRVVPVCVTGCERHSPTAPGSCSLLWLWGASKDQVGVHSCTSHSLQWDEELLLASHANRTLTALLSLQDWAWSPWGRFGDASRALVAKLCNPALPRPSLLCTKILQLEVRLCLPRNPGSLQESDLGPQMCKWDGKLQMLTPINVCPSWDVLRNAHFYQLYLVLEMPG